MTSSQNL